MQRELKTTFAPKVRRREFKLPKSKRKLFSLGFLLKIYNCHPELNKLENQNVVLFMPTSHNLS